MYSQKVFLEEYCKWYMYRGASDRILLSSPLTGSLSLNISIRFSFLAKLLLIKLVIALQSSKKAAIWPDPPQYRQRQREHHLSFLSCDSSPTQ